MVSTPGVLGWGWGGRGQSPPPPRRGSSESVDTESWLSPEQTQDLESSPDLRPPPAWRLAHLLFTQDPASVLLPVEEGWVRGTG